MADTDTHGGPAHGSPVEPDNVHFAGLGWFTVILTITTIFCAVIVWGLFVFLAHRADEADLASPRPVTAAAADDPGLLRPRAPLTAPGDVLPPLPPGPNLDPDEPITLRAFRAREEQELTTYGWEDRNAGTIRIPIERAKDLLLERGLPVRPGGM